MRIGIDIHGVLDRSPQKYIELAQSLRCMNNFYERDNEVHIITGPPKEKALQELSLIARAYNQGRPFWDHVHSIVDWVKDNHIPHYYDDKGQLWTEDEDEWNMIKGKVASAYKLDLHFDDTLKYKEYFDPGVFVHVERVGEKIDFMKVPLS